MNQGAFAQIPTPPIRIMIETSPSLWNSSADPRYLIGNQQYTAAQSPIVFEVAPEVPVAAPMTEEEAKKEYFPFFEKVAVMEELKKDRP
jgi:hypothetical protein